MPIPHNAIFAVFKTQITLLENERKAKESHITTMEAALAKSKEESTSLEHQQGNVIVIFTIIFGIEQINHYWLSSTLCLHTRMLQRWSSVFFLTELLQDKVKKFESIITSQQVQIQHAEEMIGLNKVRVQE